MSSTIAVGRPVARTAPARIPACRFLAPGSSKILASVSDNPKEKFSFGIVVAVASSEVGIAESGASSPDNVSFASYVLPSAPSPCDRRDRLRVLWADLTPYGPSAALLLVELAYLIWRLNAAFPRLGSGRVWVSPSVAK